MVDFKHTFLLSVVAFWTAEKAILVGFSLSMFCCQGKPGMDFKNRGQNQNFGGGKGAVSTEVCNDYCIRGNAYFCM